MAGLDLTRQLRAVWTGPPEPPAGPGRDLVLIAARLAAIPAVRRRRTAAAGD